MTLNKGLIVIDLGEVKTIDNVMKIIEKIRVDGGSMKPFMFKIEKDILIKMYNVQSVDGTIFGVPFIVIDKIDKQRIREVIKKEYASGFNNNYQTKCWNDALDRISKKLGLDEMTEHKDESTWDMTKADCAGNTPLYGMTRDETKTIKLKTLKDILPYHKYKEVMRGDRFVVKKLRQEAIKWIKADKSNFHSRIEKDAIQDWIKHFFNIDDEELK